MGAAQGKRMGCVGAKHPRAGELLREKRVETGSTWGKKNPTEKNQEHSRCKKQGKGRRRERASSDTRSAGSAFCRHLKQEKSICCCLGRENSPGKAQREAFAAFPLPLQSWNARDREAELREWGWNREKQGRVSEICDSHML